MLSQEMLTASYNMQNNSSKFDPFCKKNHKCVDCETRCLNRISFLNDLPENVQNSLMEKSEYKKCDKGTYIFHEGDNVGCITIIRKGQVKLTTNDLEGREKIIGIFSDNDTIWEGIFLEDSHYPYNAVCLTDTHICKIYRKDIEHSVNDISIALNVISMLSSKLHNANQRNMILSISDPLSKIASFLIYCEKLNSGEIIRLKLDDIAASVGLRPETVSRNIHKLISMRYIKRVGQSGIEILDYNSLDALSKSE